MEEYVIEKDLTLSNINFEIKPYIYLIIQTPSNLLTVTYTNLTN